MPAGRIASAAVEMAVLRAAVKVKLLCGILSVLHRYRRYRPDTRIKSRSVCYRRQAELVRMHRHYSRDAAAAT